MAELIRPEFDRPPPTKLLSYLRLMRLPNVFTAIADIAMGYLFVHQLHADTFPWLPFLLLMAASAMLYTAGMIWNDVFDVAIDQQERPFRPLPSGQISLSVARQLASALLFGGVVIGAAAGWLHTPVIGSPWRSGIVSAILAVAILAYDGWLKHTPLGPVSMGLCRFLNVLLGMSLAGFDVPPEQSWLGYHATSWLVATGIGVYITGVTWFARSEADTSNRMELASATVVMIIGMAMLPLVAYLPREQKPTIAPQIALLLFGVMGLPTLRRTFSAIQDPQPANVQTAIRFCIMSLIVLDAAVTLVTSGAVPALLVAALLAPMVLLGRWVYST